MTTLDVKVSFYDAHEPAFDAVLSVTSTDLTIEVDDRLVGAWPAGQVSLAVSHDSVVVLVEGERLLVESVDTAALRDAFGLLDVDFDGAQRHLGGASHPNDPNVGEGGSRSGRGRHLARRAPSSRPRDPMQRLRAVDPSIDLRTYDEPRGQTGDESFVKLLRHELIDLKNALAVARTQLRWVEDLTPRRLPIPVQADEIGLGVVRGVRLKETGELPGADGSRPWVTVDWGNAYVTDRRLVFCGVSDVEFGFAEIQRKGASRTGLLLGVSSREGAHLLEGPGERLAVVLTAAEKIAIGLDPTLPFNETIERLTAEIDTVSRRLEAEIESASEGSHGLDLPAHSA